MSAINIYGFIGIFLFALAQCEPIKVIDSYENDAGPYKPNWESLDKRPLPVWYDDAKFGIFMHWGVYSVPGFGSEWFWSNWKSGDKPVEEYMKSFYPPDYSYQNFGPDFKAEFFNATKWASILHNSGAKYVVLTSKHHEGFTLWPSTKAFSWNAVDVGPHRDLVGELSKAVRKQGLHFGVYYSLYEWFNPMYEADRASNFTQQIYVDNKMLPELKELVTEYKPDVIWTDGDWEAEDKYFRSEEFLAWLYNESPIKDTVVTNDRWGKDIPCHHGGIYTCTDRYNPQTLQVHKWENCMTVDRKSWGFRKNADIEDIFSIEELIKELVTTVSCGGNLLMNVGPTKEGTIAPIYQERLKSMGQWLDINGEAIFKTSPWLFQNDTLNGDVWYTSKPIQSRHRERINSPKITIYAIVLKWPKNNRLGIASLADMSHRSVIMLGTEDLGPLKWHQDGSTVWIDLPDISTVKSQWAWSLKLTN